MTTIIVKNNNVDFGIRRLKTEVAKNGTLSKARERNDGYKKPGVRRREKKEQGIKNTRKRERFSR